MEPRRRGRPPATEDRTRLQFTIRSSTYQELAQWHHTGSLARTFSGSVQYIIESWLEANREMLPYLAEANAMQQSIIRSKRQKTMRRVLRTKTANLIAERSKGFLPLTSLQEAIDQDE